MAAIAGFLGQVLVNGATLRAQNWRLRWSTDQIDVTNFINVGWASYIGGLSDADLEIDCIFDPNDNPFMGVPNLLPGQIVAVNLNFVKTNIGTQRFYFPAITILSIDSTSTVRDAVKYHLTAKICSYDTSTPPKVPGQS
jgi:hypothetical protein